METPLTPGLFSPTVLPHTLALFAALMGTAAAQLMLKLGASRGRTWFGGLTGGWTLAGYALFLGVTVLSVFALQRIELKVVTAWTGLTYVLVTMASHFLLGEGLSRRRVAGTTLIVVGIGVFYL